MAFYLLIPDFAAADWMVCVFHVMTTEYAFGAIFIEFWLDSESKFHHIVELAIGYWTEDIERMRNW
jgi:hypothetical protein